MERRIKELEAELEDLKECENCEGQLPGTGICLKCWNSLAVRMQEAKAGRDATYNRGLERAADIAEDKIDNQWSDSAASMAGEIAEAIRKEIKA